uniref:Uncharacterized protein n=1 Tax=Salix viminalis TaxID=40686 RepID=A0A6N2MF54_SALVM
MLLHMINYIRRKRRVNTKLT